MANNSTEPWNRPLHTRLQTLMHKAPGLKKVIYLYEQADTSTFRYRAYNMCQALSSSNKWKGEYFFEKELDHILPFIHNADLFIFVRTRWSEAFQKFIQFIKIEQIPHLFDADDLIFDVKYIPMILNTLGIDSQDTISLNSFFSYVSRLHLMASLCQGTIGTNAYINEKLENTLQTPSFIIPNFLNTEQIRTSDPLFAEKATLKKTRDAFVLGYFSGTPTHRNDFNQISGEVYQFLQDHPQSELHVVGFMEFPPFLKPLLKQKRIQLTPLVDFLTLQRLIASVDVNLVPLYLNDFTNCKSELKFFEAAIVGTITCAAPSFTYRNAIQHGQTGYLCAQGAWYDTLKSLSQNPPSSNMIAHMKQEALDRYHPECQLKVIEEVLDKALLLQKTNL